MYRYVNAGGRTVYTNVLEQVPMQQRSTALVDLRRVQLNTEVGSELQRHLAEEYGALQGSPYCQTLLAGAQQGFFAKLWEDYAPLLACGAGLLLLLVCSPWAMRRFGAPAWANVLGTALPAFALSGLIMFSMTSTNKLMLELKQRAKPCESETFTKLGGEGDAIRKQSALVDQLKREMASLDKESR